MTDNSGPVEPLRGKYETEDKAVICRDRRMNGLSGRLYLGNRRMCVEDKGLRTRKKKRGILEDVQGQAGQEGVG